MMDSVYQLDEKVAKKKRRQASLQTVEIFIYLYRPFKMDAERGTRSPAPQAYFKYVEDAGLRSDKVMRHFQRPEETPGVS
jgi:hypothetical protein